MHSDFFAGNCCNHTNWVPFIPSFEPDFHEDDSNQHWKKTVCKQRVAKFETLWMREIMSWMTNLWNLFLVSQLWLWCIYRELLPLKWLWLMLVRTIRISCTILPLPKVLMTIGPATNSTWICLFPIFPGILMTMSNWLNPMPLSGKAFTFYLGSFRLIFSAKAQIIWICRSKRLYALLFAFLLAKSL